MSDHRIRGDSSSAFRTVLSFLEHFLRTVLFLRTVFMSPSIEKETSGRIGSIEDDMDRGDIENDQNRKVLWESSDKVLTSYEFQKLLKFQFCEKKHILTSFFFSYICATS